MPNKQIFLGDTGFGERLRFLREKAGLSQTDLAQKLGFKRSSSVSNLETGKSPPDLKTLQKIVSCFNVNLHWLITGKPSPDGEAWRENYSELLRMYHSDVGWWIDRLKTELADWKKKALEISEKESRAEKANPFALERINEKIGHRQRLLDKIEEHLKQAFDRLGVIRL